nr:metallopeptidase TldD-related protein [Myxococcus sp. AM011]
MAEAARDVLEGFRRAHPSLEAELFVIVEGKLTLELEAATGAFAASQGVACSVVARVWDAQSRGVASGPVRGREDLERWLDTALRGVAAESRPAPASFLTVTSLPAWRWEPSVERARNEAVRLVRTVVPPGTVVQALVSTHRSTWSALLRSSGGVVAHGEDREEAFVRCETSRGAVVDAVARVPGQDALELESLRERLQDAVAALEDPAKPLAQDSATSPVDAAEPPSSESRGAEVADPTLPLVLRPAVAAPLVAGLAWLLRGDVAAATPALARAVGKKAFPSVLSVEDDPLHPQGTRRREWDDEGREARAVRLVDEGRLMGFLHSEQTATRLGAQPCGRGLREGASEASASALNFFISPRGDALPAHYTELVARVETFTTMPRPGRVSLIAGGWEVRDGRRVRRIAPMSLELPVLETFRALRGVGADLTFFPTAEGCGTPTLILPPPSE